MPRLIVRTPTSCVHQHPVTVTRQLKASLTLPQMYTPGFTHPLAWPPVRTPARHPDKERG
jgi:hypothetical protein